MLSHQEWVYCFFRPHSIKSNARVPSVLTVRNASIEEKKPCCKVILPPLIEEKQSTVMYSCTTYSSQKYGKKCGIFGWSRCTNFRTVSS